MNILSQKNIGTKLLKLTTGHACSSCIHTDSQFYAQLNAIALIKQTIKAKCKFNRPQIS